MTIAIVTGATSGMGKEILYRMLEEKHDYDEIWLLGRREDRMKSWSKRFPRENFRTFVMALDKDQQRETFYGYLEKVKPEVSVFVHAAGFGIMGRIDEIKVEEQEEMAQVNITSTIGLTGHILPFMKEGGRMIYFASAAAFLPQPGFAVYAASKSFVLSYVRSLRAENRHRGLRVTAVCPGAVKTEFFKRAAVLHKLPFYKKAVIAKPENVAGKAWRDNGRDREISVYGLPMKLFFLGTKILPHRCFLHFMGKRK